MLSRSLLRLRSVSRPAGLAACPQAALHALAALVCVRGKVPAPVRELSAWRRKPVMPCWDKQQQQQQLRPLVLSSHFGSSPKRWLTTSAADSADTSSSSSSSPVKVAPSAYKRLRELESQLGRPVTLRLQVDAGGCEGFSYKFVLEREAQESQEDDMLIDPALAVSDWDEGEVASQGKRRRSKDAEDAASAAPAPEVREAIRSRLVVDTGSLEFLQGSTVVYTQNLIKSVFEVGHNPNVDSTCGCKSSFSVNS